MSDASQNSRRRRKAQEAPSATGTAPELTGEVTMQGPVSETVAEATEDAPTEQSDVAVESEPADSPPEAVVQSEPVEVQAVEEPLAVQAEVAAPTAAEEAPQLVEREYKKKPKRQPPAPAVADDPEQIQVAEQEVKAKKPRRGFFAWLASGFRKKPTDNSEAEVVVEETPPEPVLPEGLAAEDFDKSTTALKKEAASLRRELREIDDRKVSIEAEVQANGDRAFELAEEAQKITDWGNQVSRSFIGQVISRMDSDLASAKSDMNRHRTAVENIKTFEPGQLLKLRQAFHRRFTWALIICLGLAAVVTGIRFRENIPRLDWLAFLYDPNISGPILIVASALVIGIWLLLARRKKAKPRRRWRFLPRLLTLAAAGWAIWDSSRTPSVMRDIVAPFIERHYVEILTAIGSLFVIWVLASLILYYRGHSIFEREVETQIHDLQGVIDGYVKTQQEISRLSLLYRQTNDWLEIMANALYRPWKVNPDWGTTKEYTSHFESFPFALRVAQAKEGADARMAELRRIIGSRLLTQGWRNDAFEDLVTEVGFDMGLPPGKFVVDLLDKDLPHQSNNSRQILKRYLVHSAQQAHEPESTEATAQSETSGKRTLSDNYLVAVAKKRLLDLIDKTQTVAISAARPRVEQIFEDPLVSLRSDSAGIEDFDPTESWDDFLRDSIGADSVDQIPLGVLSFNQAGRMKNLPSKVQSFVLVPKRLEKTLPKISSDSISVVPLGDDRPRPLEIIARIDVVGPVELEHLTIFGDAKPAASEPRQQRAKTIEPEEL
jgi:hypothetical protein